MIIATDRAAGLSEIEMPEIQDISAENIDSPAIRRLIQDMQEEWREVNPNAYNRTYNRHNRGR